MMKRIWCLGDAVVDLLPDGAGRLLQCPGGAPANVAVGIARLAGNSGFIGRVGDDPFGHFLRRTLDAGTGGYRVSHMRQDPPQRTSTVVVALDEQGERSFTFMVRPSADLFLTPDDLPPFQRGEWLHCCSIAFSAEPSRTATFTAMPRIREAGGFVSFDPNIRHDLWADAAELLHDASVPGPATLADVVKLSVEELAFLTATADIDASMQQLAERFAIPLLLVTQGKAGVKACLRGALSAWPTQRGYQCGYHRRGRCLCGGTAVGAGAAGAAGG